MKEKVVILLSDKRSGSTLFQRELCKHKDIQTVAYSSHTYLETHHWLKAAVILENDPTQFAEGKRYKGYGSIANAKAYIVDTVKGNLSDFNTNLDDRNLVFSSWEAICQKFAEPVFFEKSPQYLAHPAALNLLMEWVEATDFEVKVIGLSRNPMAVMYSAYELFHTTPDKRQNGWRKIQENLSKVAKQLGQDQFMRVKYEDLIQDSRSIFSKVLEFIGVEDDPSVGSTAHNSSLNRWVDDPYYPYQLNAQVKALALDLGYSEAELYNPDKPKPPFIYRLKRSVKAFVSLSGARLRDQWYKPLIMRLKNIQQ